VALWVASIGAVALTVRSILWEAVPLNVAIAALAGYVGLALLGVLAPKLEMYGDVVCSGDRASAGVALTFDDGPHPVTTRRVLEVLAETSATATFFLVGAKAERYPDVVRAIVAGGHTIGAHGYSHDTLYAFLSPSAVAEDIRRTQAVIESASGVRALWFRPPVGQVSPRTVAGAKRAGLEIVAWSVRGFDGLRRTDPDRLLNRIERGLKPGAIVLLHDAAEHDDFTPASVGALPRLLEIIREKGLRVVPLGELLGQS
jgi:peptidoglycan-N-acetylglucosamine deacetylase